MPAWKSAERQRAKAFAESLDSSRLQAARTRENKPHATAEEIVESLAKNREELRRVLIVFDVKKPDMVSFFRGLRPLLDIRRTKLANTPVAELELFLLSYFT